MIAKGKGAAQPEQKETPSPPVPPKGAAAVGAGKGAGGKGNLEQAKPTTPVARFPIAMVGCVTRQCSTPGTDEQGFSRGEQLEVIRQSLAQFDSTDLQPNDDDGEVSNETDTSSFPLGIKPRVLAYILNPNLVVMPTSMASSSTNKGQSIWAIADTGANMHLFNVKHHMHNLTASAVEITGYRSETIAGESDGEFNAYLQGRKMMHGFHVSGTYVPGTFVNPFSISRAAEHWHTVIHHGKPQSCMHGMFIAGTDDFVPFVWDPDSLLWWIELHSGARSTWGAVNEFH